MLPENPPSGHELLWAPWRAKWVGSLAGARRAECPFCLEPDEQPSTANLLVHRGASGFVMLNLYPYNGGHLLVVPYRHVARLRDLEPAERSELLELVVRAQDALEGTHHPHGFNVGLNEGRAGGAGIASHLHWHVVPRWEGDASFMTSIGGLRVVPEDLPSCWERLRKVFQA